MLSCCAAELDPALRVVVAEEVFEADIPLRQEGIVLKHRRALHAGCSHRRMAQSENHCVAHNHGPRLVPKETRERI